METRSLENLEYPKILRLLAGLAGSQAARDAIVASQPLTEVEPIRRALDELDGLLGFLAGGGNFPIGGIREMRPILATLQRGDEVLSGDDLLLVRANVETGSAVKKAWLHRVKGLPTDATSPFTDRLLLLPDLGNVRDRILQAIDEKGEVRDDATPRLAGIRRELVTARQEIERRLLELVGSNNDIYQDRFFTIRNDRYVVPVKVSSQSLVQGIVHDQSGSGQTLFMEPLEFLAHNNRLVRLKADEREEIHRILAGLTQFLQQRSGELAELFHSLVHLDGLHARARFAQKYDGIRPEIADSCRLSLKDARHPLLHPNCVPLDVALDAASSCVIITGPNGGGKTVALKTVAINALLLQSGSYILAGTGSVMPVFRTILADIGESQSIEDHLSTFTAHLQRLKEILDECDVRTLVLIDEIGTGTNPEEGAALATGVLKAIRKRSALAMVTSHFDALKEIAFTTPGFVNAGMEFDYQTFRPTFRMAMGVPGKSNALAVARQFGLPEEVLSELAGARHEKGGAEQALLDSLERERSRAEALRRAWAAKMRDVNRQQEELDAALTQLRDFRRTRRDQVSEEYETRLKERVREIERVIHELKKKLAQGVETVAVPDLETARQAHATGRKELRQLEDLPGDEPSPAPAGPPPVLNVGDRVVWKTMPSAGILREIDTTRGRGWVDFDGKNLAAPLAELRPALLPPGRKETGGSVILSVPTVIVSDRIDLRGFRADEALEKAEAYLKTAQAQKLGRVYLVHGKGTGALQKAVNAFLQRSPWKKQFRMGRYGEGDLGVTVVVFDPTADGPPVESDLKPSGPPVPKRFRRK